jgi:hypothetical protein
MSCFNQCYLPQPPREWSRVQNPCSLFIDNNYNNNTLVISPYTGKTIPISQLDFELAMFNKGNILQYKKNSSNLTKSQRYSKIAKGQWTNRNTTWATQNTRGYTNPNNLSLQRNGSINITLDGTTTNLPITCPQPINIINDALPPSGSESKNPETLPPPPPEPSANLGETFPISPVPEEQPIVIQDLGTLTCSIQENICTGQIISKQSSDNCYPTTDSDVPGNIQLLCWEDGLQTWYPRQRYVMTNSGNKWPVNAPLFSAIIVPPPTITSIQSNTNNDVTIQWIQTYSCLPITSFTLFQNDIPIQLFNSNTFNVTINNLSIGNYSFFLISSSENIVSQPSNIVSISIIPPPPITIQATNIQNVPEQKITSDNNYYYYEFINNDIYTITVNKNITNFEYLIIGPGGNGGNGVSNAQLNGSSGGGGGSGGIVTGIFNTQISDIYLLDINTLHVILYDTDNQPISQANKGGNGNNGTIGSSVSGGSGGTSVLSKYSGQSQNGTQGNNGIYSTNTSSTPANGGNGAIINGTLLNVGTTNINYEIGGNGGNGASSNISNRNGFNGNRGGGGGGGGASDFTNGSGASGGKGYTIIYFLVQ